MAKILIVHDTPKYLEAIRDTALAAGYAEIVEAVDEESAYKTIDSAQFDVAVIDISLTKDQPTTEGLGIIKALRERQPRCRIIGLTTAHRDLGVKVLDEGADDFIYTGWATIDYLDLLRHKLTMWRRARPRRFMVV